jgi:anaerobic selenocysteine-containing dehydrogenase
MKRRDFLKIGGTLGTGSLVLDGCGKPDQKLIPLLVSEEELVPGIERWVASLCQQCPAGCGITVRVMQGESVRMIDGQATRIKTAQAKKIEGNAKHPLNLGKTCARGQAGLQVLYNPDRIQNPLKLVGRRGSGKYQSVTWTEAIQTLVNRLGELQRSRTTEGLVMLTGTRPRASMKALLERFARSFGTPHLISCDLLEHSAGRAAFSRAGGAGMPVYDIANTNYLLSLGSNPLETFLSPVRYSLAYGQMRQGRPGIRGKFVQAEPRLSLTAVNADEWLPIRPETQGLLALSLAHVIVRESLHDEAFVAKQTTGFEEWSETLSLYSPERVSPQVDIPVDTIVRIAGEFAQRQPSLAIGDSKSVSAMLAIHALNALVGNYGKPGGVLFDLSPAETALPLPKELTRIQDLPGSVFDLPGLVKAQEADGMSKVRAILLFESNPLFLWPKPRELFEAFDRVPFTASFASFLDESTVMADLILPSHTYLERWQDDIPQPGIGIPIRTLAQPVVKPRFDTRDPADVLLNVARSLGGLVAEALPWKDSVNLIQDHFRPLHALKRGSVVADQFKDFWAKARLEGGWWDTEATRSSNDRNLSFKFRFLNTRPDLKTPSFAGQETDFPFLLHLYPSIGLSDGRGANQPWLQEMPDPMTSVMWNSWVEINPQTAARLGIQEGDVLALESPVGKVELPAYLFPGLRPEVIAIPIGHGHHTYGRYASRGANPLELTTISFDPESLSHVHDDTRLRIRLTDRRVQLPKFGSDVREHGQEALRR